MGYNGRLSLKLLEKSVKVENLPCPLLRGQPLNVSFYVLNSVIECIRIHAKRVKGEVHSRMAIYFLYANKKVIQKYVIHQNFSFQRALNPYEIFL